MACLLASTCASTPKSRPARYRSGIFLSLIAAAFLAGCTGAKPDPEFAKMPDAMLQMQLDGARSMLFVCDEHEAGRTIDKQQSPIMIAATEAAFQAIKKTPPEKTDAETIKITRERANKLIPRLEAELKRRRDLE